MVTIIIATMLGAAFGLFAGCLISVARCNDCPFRGSDQTSEVHHAGS